MGKPNRLYQAEPAELKALLEAAWPGIKVMRSSLKLDDSDGSLRGFFEVLAKEPALLASRIVSEVDLATMPRGGIGKRRGRHIRRQKRGTLVHFNFYDSFPYEVTDNGIFDFLASVLIPSIWQPPKLAA